MTVTDQTPAPAARTRSRGALTLGSLAAGAVALGAVAIGAFAIGRLTVRRAHFGTLEVDHLIVHDLDLPD